MSYVSLRTTQENTALQDWSKAVERCETGMLFRENAGIVPFPQAHLLLKGHGVQTPVEMFLSAEGRTEEPAQA